MKKNLRKTARILLIIAASLMLLVLATAWAVTRPAVQNWLVEQARGFLEESIGTRVELDAVDFALPNKAVLTGLQIYDADDELALSLGEFRLNLISFSLWEYILNRRETHELAISDIELYQPEIHLRRMADSSFNLAPLFRLFQNQDTTTGSRAMQLNFSTIRLYKGIAHLHLLYGEDQDSVVSGKLDFGDLLLENINSEFSLQISPQGALNSELRQLSFWETHSGFRLDELRFKLNGFLNESWEEDSSLVADGGVQFADLFLAAQRHRIRGTLQFPRSTLVQVFDRKADDYAALSLEKSLIDFNALSYFLPKPLPLNGVVEAHGQLAGTLDFLVGRQVYLSYLDQTSLLTDFSLTDYRYPDRALMNISILQTQVDGAELANLLPDLGIPQPVQAAKLLDLEGNLRGNYFDFRTELWAETSEGRLAADLHLILPPRSRQIRYDGEVKTQKLDAVALGMEALFPSRRLNLTAKLKGQGVSAHTANLSFKGGLRSSIINSFEVDSLFADLSIAEGKVNGQFNLLDKKGRVNVNAGLNLLASPPQYRAKGTLRDLDLAAFKVLDEPVKISTDLDLNMTGDSLENFIGEISLKRNHLFHTKKQELLKVPSLALSVSGSADSSKFFHLLSPLAEASLKGNFTLNQSRRLLTTLVEEARLFIGNRDSVIQAYYATKQVDSSSVVGSYDFVAGDSLSALMEFLQIPLRIAANSQVAGDFEFGITEILNLDGTIPAMSWEDLHMQRGKVSMNFFKQADNNDMAFSARLQMDSLQLGEEGGMEGVRLDIDGFKDEFESTLIASQPSDSNRIQMQLLSQWFDDGSIRSVLNASRSYLLIKGDMLEVRENAEILYANRGWEIYDLHLENNGTYLRVNGAVSNDPGSKLNIQVGQLELNVLHDLYPFRFEPQGKFNADVQLSNLLHDPAVAVYSLVNDFELDEFAYGDLSIKCNWLKSVGKLQIDGTLFEEMGDESTTTISLKGYYDFADQEAPLHFNLDSPHPFPLNYAYPFVRTQLSGIKGKVELDQFTIRGSFDKLNVNGTGHFTDAGFEVDYFKTAYTFAGSIRFDNDRIVFPRIRLYDRYLKHAELHGFIYHEGLRRFVFDLQVDEVDNFLVMDTQKGDNPLFYGKVFMKDGIADITGDLSKLKVNAFASSGPNSELKIPITYGTELARPDFIHFIGEEDLFDRTINTGLEGFEINLNAIANEDLQIELIFDEQVGDIIQGNGFGNLSLNINETGEFSINGNYEITRGNYLFTAQNVLNKKFEVKSGGRITWSGDPYSADVKLDAYYPLYADIRELINETQAVRTPVNVLMHMEGKLLEPQIQLSIELPNVNDNNVSEIAGYLKTIQYDEQELNKQVFSLMVFNRFAPTGGFLGEDLAGMGVTTSVSELLSNQLNFWLSKALNDNLNVNVGTSNFQDVNLLISYKFFNDRVVVERDGTLLSANSNLSLGNLSIIIKLLPRANPRGGSQPVQTNELVLEVFNRENLDTQLNSQTNQTGIGVFYKRDFDRLGQIFGGRKRP